MLIVIKDNLNLFIKDSQNNIFWYIFNKYFIVI